MARAIQTLFIFFIGWWFSLVAAQHSEAQYRVAVPGDPVRIADLGLDHRVPSAIDLVGPEDGSAGDNRALLVRRLQCWIDGDEGCSVADLNDPRVREIRRFLTQGPFDRHGVLVVHFPDKTRVQVLLERASEPERNDWNESVYEPVALPSTARAPGLAAVPSRPGQLESFAYDGAPAIRAALERLKQRLKR